MHLLLDRWEGRVGRWGGSSRVSAKVDPSTKKERGPSSYICPWVTRTLVVLYLLSADAAADADAGAAGGAAVADAAVDADRCLRDR